MKKKIVSLCMVVCLLAVAIVGGTMAYFTDTKEVTNTMTFGNVQITQNEQQRAADGSLVDYEASTLLPSAFDNNGGYHGTVTVSGKTFNVWDTAKNAQDKIVTVTNSGTVDAYVRTVILFEGDPWYGNDINVIINDTAANGVAFEHIGQLDIGGKQHTIFLFTYTEKLTPGTTTTPSLVQVALDSDVTKEMAAAYGNSYEIKVVSQAVQADGFASANEALDAAFGDITLAKNPFVS